MTNTTPSSGPEDHLQKPIESTEDSSENNNAIDSAKNRQSAFDVLTQPSDTHLGGYDEDEGFDDADDVIEKYDQMDDENYESQEYGEGADIAESGGSAFEMFTKPPESE